MNLKKSLLFLSVQFFCLFWLASVMPSGVYFGVSYHDVDVHLFRPWCHLRLCRCERIRAMSRIFRLSLFGLLGFVSGAGLTVAWSIFGG